MENSNVTPLVPKDKNAKEETSLVSSLSPREIVSELDRFVVGQNKAKKAVAVALRNRWRRQALKGEMKNEVLPKNILMIGPTGVGKTETARQLANELSVELVRFDMSEYQEKHSVAKLIGSPPGYVGYEDSAGLLITKLQEHPNCVLLLDEIEKAHPDTFNVLLQVLDEGRLMDNKGRLADFKNSIIIMTSNLGSHEIQTAFEENPKFETAESVAKEKVTSLLKKQIRPEFLNRIDDIVLFSPLTQKEIQKIVELQMDKIAKRLSTQEITLHTTTEAIVQLARLGFDPQYGGRPVKRTYRNMCLIH